MKKRVNNVSASDRALLANIKQFGLGSWLGENAGTIGSIAGAGIGTLIAPGMGTSLGASIGGQLGGMAQKEYMSNNQPQQQISPEQMATSQESNRVYKMGGYKYNNGGDVDNTVSSFEGGGTHEQNPYGGIPIGNGNSVEAGEVKAKFKEGDYIYSNRLLTGDKKKETYADVAKRLKAKFKNADNDPVVKNDLMEELAKVRNTQEELRGNMGIEGNGQKALGGYRYAGGGLLKGTESNLTYDPNSLQPQNITKVDYTYGANNNLNIPFTNNYNSVPNNQNLTSNNGVDGYSKQKEESFYNTTSTQGTESYKTLGNTAWLQGAVGAIPSLAGNLYMGLSAKANMPNYQRVESNLVDRSREREIANRTATESKASNYRNLRQIGENQGTVLSGIGAINAGVNRTLGDVVGQSYSNEYNTNAAIKNQASAQNAQIQMAETEARAREKDAIQNIKNNAIKGGLSTMENYGKGILQNQSDLMKTSAMMPTDYTLVDDGKGGVRSIFVGKDSPYTYNKDKKEWAKKIKAMGGYKSKK